MLAATITEAPALLAGRFPEGALADATLAAYADLLAARIDIAPPPPVSAELRRANNAERQRRFQQRRRELLRCQARPVTQKTGD